MLSPLASPKATKAVLEAHGLDTKYSLGQNFLVNDAILRKIVDLAELDPADYVLEVGPGAGTLTIALLKCAGRVLSVERDPDLPQVLERTLKPWWDRYALISKDAVELQVADLEANAPQFERVLPNKLVANLPYAVAATVVLGYFQDFGFLDSATVMVQKEVADRMCAQKGTKNYGAYTVKLHLYAQPAGRFPVSPNNFFPPPRVDSAVLRLNRVEVTDDDGNVLTPAQLRDVCTVADAAFANRRKTISNSFKTFFAGRGAVGATVLENLPELLAAAGIDPKRRGETLDQAEFVRLGAAYRALLGE
ncbi:MAG: 16S rRNA (adenine(1518)-N(6)/adenine(1519)-N(6))-dimethyltransferase RsmA [Coriobacteriia bacterium]|nr:16S rRNA (adenine(1518)-N(6)/adenine(1519)-N(6))-dimethyltransferase RsmA [Coriobacteriia bacterium]